LQYIIQLNIHGYNIFMIPWNIFLAIIPCLVAYYSAKAVRKKKWKDLKGQQLAFMLIFLFWLFMFPNTAYLFMIPRHLVNYCRNFDTYRVCLDGGSWLVMFFSAYALIGLPTFYYALNKMERLFRSMCGKIYAVFLPIIVIPLTSIAVMFGLYERFNSWDVIFRPCELIRTVTSYFTDPRMIADFLGFTACLYLIYYITRYALDRRTKELMN
jgi:uncharacterized membrane protein